MAQLTGADILDGGKAVQMRWPDGSKARFHAIWLRNNAPDEAMPDDTEDNHHDDAGAEMLEHFFPSVIVDCVRLHVAAKRYLCATDPAYFDHLSPASDHTLQLQGGPLTAHEVGGFEAEPNFREAVRVRVWDEGGKNPDMQTPDFAHYIPLLERVRHA